MYLGSKDILGSKTVMSHVLMGGECLVGSLTNGTGDGSCAGEGSEAEEIYLV